MRQNQAPDWRRRRAVLLIDNDLNPSRTRDDKIVRRIFKFLKRRRRLDVRATERLANEMPDLAAAFEINEDTQCGIRWIFEASIMADRSHSEMAEYLRTDISVLKTYEEVFFDVRDALDGRGCIVGNVLMPIMRNNVIPRDPDVMWKALSYFGGWDVAKSCWEIGHVTPAAIDFLQKVIHEKIIHNSFDALHTVQIHNMNAHEFVRAGMDKQRQDFEMGNISSGNQATTALSGLMHSIRTHVRRTDERLPAAEPRLQLSEPEIIDVTPVPKEAKGE